MTHATEPADFILPTIDDFLAGDSRVLSLTLENDSGVVDISGATVEWRAFDREYQTGDADAVLTGDDSDVEIVTDNRVDTSQGEFEVRLDPSATEDLWGVLYHRPKVIQSDGSEATWIGEIVLTA